MAHVLGLHHVTAIARDPQRNVDFYAGVLGLRLVKRTVNFDDPQTYHLYYGDEVGTPGSIMTFFPWPHSRAGRPGPKQVGVTSFAVLPASLGFWVERFLRHGVQHERLTRRQFGRESERVLAFRDPEGLLLELVAHPGAEGRPGWGDAPEIARDHAIRGFHGVTMWVEDGALSERVLVESLGCRPVDEEDGIRRFESGDGGVGTFVNVRATGGFVSPLSGAGTVHHVAFRVADDDAELAVRERVIGAGLHPTQPIDRTYFRSVYFHEPGGVLFELATDTPGFAVDEPAATLGSALKLPPQYEPMRGLLEESLPPIHLPGPRGIDAWLEGGGEG